MSSKMIQLTVWREPNSKIGAWLTPYEFKNFTYQEWCEREMKRFKQDNAIIRTNKRNKISIWKEREKINV